MKIPSLEEMHAPSKESWYDRHKISKKFGGDFAFIRTEPPNTDNFAGIKKVKTFCSERHRKIRLGKIRISLKEYFETVFCLSCYSLSHKKNSVLD